MRAAPELLSGAGQTQSQSRDRVIDKLPTPGVHIAAGKTDNVEVHLLIL